MKDDVSLGWKHGRDKACRREFWVRKSKTSDDVRS